jgi:hypothetical protein
MANQTMRDWRAESVSNLFSCAQTSSLRARAGLRATFARSNSAIQKPSHGPTRLAAARRVYPAAVLASQRSSASFFCHDLVAQIWTLDLA